jgi:hypothetical protein
MTGRIQMDRGSKGSQICPKRVPRDAVLRIERQPATDGWLMGYPEV